jgi:predicted ABC-type ATPase
MNPVLLLVAGPNGSGKTTVTVCLREEQWSHNTEDLNPDDVARDRFGDWNSAEAVAKAARVGYSAQKGTARQSARYCI